MDLIATRFVRNVATVASGVAAAQILGLLFMPILTRIYEPAAFGVLAIFTALFNISAPMATLGYAHAIVLPKANEDARHIARISVMCAVIFAPLILILVALFNSEIALWVGLDESGKLLLFLPLAILAGAILMVVNQSALREGHFRLKAASQVISAALVNIAKLVGGLIAPAGAVLIAAATLGKIANSGILITMAPRTGLFSPYKMFAGASIRPLARQYRAFPLYRMPKDVISAASVGLPMILLAALSGQDSAGQYSIAALVLSAPVMLLGDSVGDVFYPKISRAIANRSNEVLRLTIKASVVLGAISLIPFGAVAVGGPELFGAIFGDEWERSGQYAQWLSIWLFFVLVTRPIVASFPALQLNGHLLAIEVVSVLLRSAALVLGMQFFNSDLVAVSLFSLVGAGVMLISAMVGFRRMRAYQEETR